MRPLIFRTHIVSVLFFFVLLLPTRVAFADLMIVGEAISVISGDLMKVIWSGGIEIVRLAEIDAPEVEQPYGPEAKIFTEDLTIARTVIIAIKDVDVYGRNVGEVFLENGKSLNQELVKNGLAWWHRERSSDETLSDLEAVAKKDKVGLWADENPVPPWEFRAGQK